MGREPSWKLPCGAEGNLSRRALSRPAGPADSHAPGPAQGRHPVDRVHRQAHRLAVAPDLEHDVAIGPIAAPERVRYIDARSATPMPSTATITSRGCRPAASAGLSAARRTTCTWPPTSTQLRPSQARLLLRELPRALSSARIGFSRSTGHEHVAAHRRAVATGRVADHQRADADQLAVGVEEAGAAVVGARRRGEEGVFDVVFPVARERPARDHSRQAQVALVAAAGEEERLVGRDRGRDAERRRRDAERRQRLDQAEAGRQVVGDHPRPERAGLRPTRGRPGRPRGSGSRSSAPGRRRRSGRPSPGAPCRASRSSVRPRPPPPGGRRRPRSLAPAPPCAPRGGRASRAPASPSRSAGSAAPAPPAISVPAATSSDAQRRQRWPSAPRSRAGKDRDDGAGFMLPPRAVRAA